MSAGTNTADMGSIQRTLESILERMDRADAETVKLKGQLSALSGRVAALESAGPSPASEPVDPDMPSEADRVAMRERLRAGTLAGIEANKADRYRAARTYRREGFDVK